MDWLTSDAAGRYEMLFQRIGPREPGGHYVKF